MTVIGKKSGGEAALYIAIGSILLLFFIAIGALVIFFVLKFNQSGVLPVIIMPLIFIPLAIWILVRGVKVARYPEDIIAVTESSVVFLATGREIPFSAVSSVICRRANARGMSYRYGDIVLVTTSGETIKQPHVAEVENVCAILQNAMRRR